ncbi:MAG: hypothetical protein H0U59_13120 [Gemmatimonadaceae bacterium]|nr:hypothetical protein [Gemmatimonadaceae bacterium]
MAKSAYSNLGVTYDYQCLHCKLLRSQHAGETKLKCPFAATTFETNQDKYEVRHFNALVIGIEE